METNNPDRIEKEVILKAPLAKVWKALTDAKEFSAWFGVTLEGAFTPGKAVKGPMSNPKYAHLSMEVTVERIEPQHHFSYRWHPAAIDPAVDYSAEPMTLVEFTLAEVPGGTRLTVVETGFEKVPAGRRAEAFRMNSHGWAAQLESITRYATQ